MNLLRIVPAECEPGQLCKTQGTRVITADGAEVEGVNYIKILCDPDDVWRAEIHCVIEPPKLPAMLASVFYRKEGFVRRWLRRLRGKALDVTSYADTFARRYRV